MKQFSLTKQKENKMNTDKITTYAGLTTAITGAILATGVVVSSSPLFVPLTILGAVGVGVLGYFTNKPNTKEY